MAIAVRGFSPGNQFVTTSGTQTLTLPAGTQAGDTIVRFDYYGDETTIWSAPSGWTEWAHTSYGAASIEIAVAVRNTTVTSGEATAGNISAHVYGNFHPVCVVLMTGTGFDQATGLDLAAATVAETSTWTNPEPLPLPAIGPTNTAGALIVSGAAAYASSPTWSSKPGTLTEGVGTTLGTTTANWWIGHTTFGSAGTSFSATTVSVNSIQYHIGFTIAIKQSSAGQPMRFTINKKLN